MWRRNTAAGERIMMISPFAPPPTPGFWLDRRRHVHRTAAGMVSRRLSAQAHGPKHDVRKNKTQSRRRTTGGSLLLFLSLFLQRGHTHLSPTAAKLKVPSAGVESPTTRRTKEDTSTHRKHYNNDSSMYSAEWMWRQKQLPTRR